MAAGRIVLPPYFPARDRNGALVSGARLYVYQNETTTKASIYSSADLTTPIANPVIANASGHFPAIWAEAGTEANPVLYSLSVTEADGGSIGNPSVFDSYRPSVDFETATLALAEAAADAASVEANRAGEEADRAFEEADRSERAADRSEDALAEIEDIAANAPEAPSVFNKADRDGGNITDAAGWREALNAAARDGSDLTGDEPEDFSKVIRLNTGTGYLTPRDFGVPADDSQDAHAAIKAMFAAGLDREMVLPKRNYDMGPRSNQNLFLPKRGRVIFADDAVLNFSAWGTAFSSNMAEFLEAEGTLASTEFGVVTDIPSAGSTTIQLSPGSGTSWARGDVGMIWDNRVWTVADGAGGSEHSERFTVARVVGDTLELTAALRDGYVTDSGISPKVRRFSDLLRLTLENVQILGPGRMDGNGGSKNGDKGILLMNGAQCRIISGYCRYADQGVHLHNLFDSQIDGLETRNELDPNVNGSNAAISYGLCLNDGCESINVTNFTGTGGRHAFVLSGSSILGVTRDIRLDGFTIRSTWAAGVATHSGHEDILITNGRIEDAQTGCDIRCGGVTVENVRMSRIAAQGFQTRKMINRLRIRGVDLRGAPRFAYIAPGETGNLASDWDSVPNDVIIEGNSAYGLTSGGVDWHFSDPTVPTLGQVIIRRNVFELSNGRAIDLEGKWDRPIVTDNVFLGTTTGRPVLIHNGTIGGSSGPISPVILRNLRTESYAAEAVQHNTGVSVWDRGQVIGAAMPTYVEFTGTFSPLSLASIASYTAGSTFTVTVTGAALGDEVASITSSNTLGGMVLLGEVTAADTVTVTCFNCTANAIDPPNGQTVTVIVRRKLA